MTKIAWLPDLIYEHKFRGNRLKFIEAVYDLFKKDFIDNQPEFRGVKLGLKRLPLRDGKEATFYHMTTKGRDEENRQHDPKRCERIRWPKPIIECENNGHSCDVKIWKSKRKGEVRINLFIEAAKYFVVLTERKGYILPWTAYCIEYNHEHRKKIKEFEKYRKRPW